MDETSRNIPAIPVDGVDEPSPGPGRSSRVRNQGAPRQRRPGRRRMRVLVAAGVVAAVAAGGAAALLASSASNASPTGKAPSALTAVTAAVAKTSAESYHFSLDLTVHFGGIQSRSDVVVGGWDPSHDLGSERLTARERGTAAVQAEVRFIGKYVYTWASSGTGLGKPWNKAPAPAPAADVLPTGDLYGFSSEQPVSPAELLGALRSAATVRDQGSASGPGWTGTSYAFTARLSARELLSGTVYIDQQGRVRRLVTTTRQGIKLRLTTDRDLTFSDFGVPVPVAAPPASQVKYTSGRPYLGFYF